MNELFEGLKSECIKTILNEILNSLYVVVSSLFDLFYRLGIGFTKILVNGPELLKVLLLKFL